MPGLDTRPTATARQETRVDVFTWTQPSVAASISPGWLWYRRCTSRPHAACCLAPARVEDPYASRGRRVTTDRHRRFDRSRDLPRGDERDRTHDQGSARLGAVHDRRAGSSRGATRAAA